MAKVIVTISALLLGFALLTLGQGLFGTLLAVRMIHEQFPTAIIGLIQSAYYLGFALGTLLCSSAIQQVGHVRAFSAFAAIATCSALLHALFVTPLLWALLRIVTGFSCAGLFMVTESWLNAKTANEIRGQIFSFYMILNYLGLGAGQFLLNLADPNEFQLFLLVAILFALSLVPTALTHSQTPTQLPIPDSAVAKPLQFSFRQLCIVSPLGIGGCLAAGLLSSAFYAMGPTFAIGVGLSVTGTASFMGFAIFSSLLLQWPIGKISDRYDRRHVLLTVVLSAAAMSLTIVILRGCPLLFYIPLIYVFTSLAFTLYGLSVAHANDFIPPEHMVAASAGLLLAFGLGASLGPTLSALLIADSGPSGLFVFFAAVMILLALFTLYRMVTGKPVPLAEKTAFVAIPATTPVLTELDPRLEASKGSPALAESAAARTDKHSCEPVVL
jgi:MFS family permease